MKDLVNSNVNVLRASNSVCLRARRGFAALSLPVAPVAGVVEAVEAVVVEAVAVVRTAAVADTRVATPVAAAAAGAKAISAVSYMPQTCIDMASKFHGKKNWRWRPLCRSGVRFG